MNIHGRNPNSPILPDYELNHIVDHFLAKDFAAFSVIRQLDKRNYKRATGVVEHLLINSPEGFSRFFPAPHEPKCAARPAHLALQFNVSTEKLQHLPDSITHLELNHQRRWPPTISAKFLEALVKQCPNIQSLNLRNNILDEDAVAVLQRFEKLTELDLTASKIANEGIKEVAKITNLTSLKVGNCDISDYGAMELPKLVNLSTLDLSGNFIGCAGAAEVAKLLELTELNMSTTDIFFDGVRALAALPNLRTLDLSDHIIFSEDSTPLEMFNKLSCLKLNDCHIDGQIPMNIAKLENLSELHLANNRIGPEGLKELLKLPKLSNLNLSSNRLGHAEMKEVANILTLTTLNLSNHLSWPGEHFDQKLNGEALAELAKLPLLSDLDLSRNSIGLPLATALTKLAHLCTLKLVKCSIGNQEVAELVKFNIGDPKMAEQPKLPNFETLDLSNNVIGDEGATLLVNRGNIATLILHGNPEISAVHIEEVRAAPNTPNINI
ncbi:leucine-rich repeat domain-containing protein [Achromobacter marplatensis]|uniref:hypothetical protein n=1 Tax=Achromobacter marplatensis TaxID=470868 RepID=UPI0039F74039